MSRYKKIMIDNGYMQKDLLNNIHRVDSRVDKSLLSKIVNDVCLPVPKVLNSICDYLQCDVLDIYDKNEIDLLNDTNKSNQNNGSIVAATYKKDRGGKSHGDNVYNLTVEIPRDLADRIFNKKSLRKLGYLSKSDCVRTSLYALDKKLQKIRAKEKAALDNDTFQSSSTNCQ